MNLKNSHAATASPTPSRQLDAVFDRYVAWREECVAVTATYENWVRARRDDRTAAFAAYVTALHAEERAASAYQQLVERAAA